MKDYAFAALIVGGTIWLFCQTLKAPNHPAPNIEQDKTVATTTAPTSIYQAAEPPQPAPIYHYAPPAPQNIQPQIHQRTAAESLAMMEGITADMRRTNQSTKPQRQAQTIAAYSNNCDLFRYGSIDYRDCRHREKERLHVACVQLGWQAENSGGHMHDIYMEQRRQTCVAYDQYAAIN